MNNSNWLVLIVVVLCGAALAVCGGSLVMIAMGGSLFGYQPTFQSASAYGIFSIALSVFASLWKN